MDVSPTELEFALARAFDIAWDRFIELHGREADTADNRGRLAARIVVLCKLGEHDEERIAEHALLYLRAFEGAMTLSAARKTHARPIEIAVERAANAFTPETIAAMSKALDLCLEELPLKLPDGVVNDLSAAILKSASAGETDPARLQAEAMQALRTRNSASGS
jgi:hypothetical protein